MLCTADFETTTQENYDKEGQVRVWAYAIMEIGNYNNFIYGNNIDDFMKWCESGNKNHTVYFHNLKFDGEFIFYYLFRNGFKWVDSNKKMKGKTFTTLISDTGVFYSMEICFSKKGHNAKKVTIYDSLKLLNFTVAKIGKDFGLNVLKIDKEKEFYERYREKNHVITKEEVDYIRNDVEVVARAIEKLHSEGMNKMTIASNALKIYKSMMNERDWIYNFPVLDFTTDEQIRHSYKGGWTYVSDRYKNKVLGKGLVLDVNSLYPWVMSACKLPIDIPLMFNGKYKKDSLYNLYIQHFTCQFKIKKNHLPTIQIKGNSRFIENQYLEESLDSEGRQTEVELSLTNVDLDLFFEHYDVFNINYLDGYKFKSSSTMFTDYINYWVKVKIDSEKDGNNAMRSIAKLMLNSLYGKFGLNPKVRSKLPVYDKSEDIVHYTTPKDFEIRDAIYIPMASFITAYAREKTIRSAQQNYETFAYADTDSIHLITEQLPNNIEIDSYILGAWKHEFSFSEAKYLRQKCYMEFGKDPRTNDKEEWKITCAGMPKGCYDQVDLENFKYGSAYSGKLQHKRVRGGVLLQETTFKIKQSM